MLVIAMVAALASAGAYAVAAALQQREAERLASRRLVEASLLWRLAHQPRWLAALACMGVATVLHLVALSRGPLLVVQPLGVTGLIYAVLLAAVIRARAVRSAEIVAALAVCAGVTGLLAVLPDEHGGIAPSSASRTGLLAGVAALAVTATLVAASAKLGRIGRSVGLSLAAAVAFGSTAAMARMVSGQVARTGWTALWSWSTLLVVLLAVAGLWLSQCAYRLGNAGGTLAIITALDPVSSAIWAVMVLHEQVPHSALGLAMMAVSATVTVTGIVSLTVSHPQPETVTGDRPQPLPVPNQAKPLETPMAGTRQASPS